MINKELINLIDCFFVCSMLVNVNGNIIYINEKGLDLFGYTKNELIDQSIQLFIPDHLKSIHLKYLLDPAVVYQHKRENALINIEM
jgi:PAS domain S-box-containing protein